MTIANETGAQASADAASLAAALKAEAEAFVQRNPKSREQLARAAQCLPGGNTRSSLFYAPFPLTMARGADSRLWDADGHEYVDLIGEFTAGLYGHSNPTVMNAIRAALEGGVSLTGHNFFEERLARAMCARFPSLDLVRFTNSGTEANLMAAALAKAHTGRDHFLVFRGGYHGALMVFGAPDAPLNAPHKWILGEYNDLDGTTALLREHGDKIAGVFIEPMLGSGGCFQASIEFLQMLRAETARIGAVLVFDEVMTSRLAPGGLQQRIGVAPDLTTFGKYLGGGCSFGAFGGREELMSRLDPTKPNALGHAGTFNNNVISMAAGYAGLAEIYTPEIAVRHNARGDALRERLNGVFEAREVPMRYTGIGSLMNVHAVRGEVRSLEQIQKSPNGVRELLFFHLVKHGYYTAKRGFVAMCLPLTDAQLGGFVDAVDEFAHRYGDLINAAVA